MPALETVFAEVVGEGSCHPEDIYQMRRAYFPGSSGVPSLPAKQLFHPRQLGGMLRRQKIHPKRLGVFSPQIYADAQ